MDGISWRMSNSIRNIYNWHSFSVKFNVQYLMFLQNDTEQIYKQQKVTDVIHLLNQIEKLETGTCKAYLHQFNDAIFLCFIQI